jgi:1-aminocyclopropane-1-carboxylate deaminase
MTPEARPDRRLLTQLDATPVLGVSLSNVSVLRLDLLGGLAPGNKIYKLREILLEADGGRGAAVATPGTSAPRKLVSFGGPWSNHLHALAALGHREGYETVGIIRGEAGPQDTAMLADAARWGMQLVNVSRTEYRRRNNPDYLESMEKAFAPCLVIPEGGSSGAGARGCMEIGRLLKQMVPGRHRVLLAVGTGTTLAGVAAGLGPDYEVTGVSALRGATDLSERVKAALEECGVNQVANWSIWHDDHCGGFARISDALREFILAFESVHGLQLDPVYTAKLMYAIYRRLESGEWSDKQPIVAIHTGGLQGRRGYSFLQLP